VSGYEGAKAILRPSGTEKVLRLYTEAKTEKEAQDLCVKICSIVAKYA